MAATRTWLGTAGDFNWGTAANWSGAAVPITGDSVVFDSTSTTKCTLGMDQSLVALVSLDYRRDCTIDVGTEASPLAISATSFMRISGSGFVGISSSGASTALLVVESLSSDSPGVYITDSVYAPGAFTQVDLIRGNIKIDNAVVISTLNVSYYDDPDNDVVLTTTAAFNCTTYNQVAGKVTNLGVAGSTTTILAGGLLENKSTTNPALGTTTVMTGGKLVAFKEGDQLVAGTFYWLGGTIDADRLQGHYSTISGTLYRFVNSTTLIDPNLDGLTGMTLVEIGVP